MRSEHHTFLDIRLWMLLAAVFASLAGVVLIPQAAIMIAGIFVLALALAIPLEKH